jgi:LPS-assembly protein
MRSFPVAVFALMLAQAPAVSRAQSLAPPLPYMQADELLYTYKGDNAGVERRVIALGNVEVHYNDYILTADRVMLDRNSKTAIAEGRVQLKDPKGTLTRADRMEMLDDMRDALLLRYLVPVPEDKSR